MSIQLRPEEIPDFFSKYKSRLRYERYFLADNGHGTDIVLTAEPDGSARLRVLNNGFLVASASCEDDDTIVEAAERLYDMFLGPDWDMEDEEEMTQALIDEAYERDEQLKLAFYDFLCTVVEDEDLIYDGAYEDEIEAIMDGVLQQVSDLGLPVRRPTQVDGEDGTYFIEYPYEETFDE